MMNGSSEASTEDTTGRCDENNTTSSSIRERSKTKRHLAAMQLQPDFFNANFEDVAGKSDIHTMEHPFFSLKKQPDTTILQYEHGGAKTTVIPSVLGRATIWDKDLLLFIASQLTEGINSGRLDINTRVVRFNAYGYFLETTGKKPGGTEYTLLEKSLQRLQGTQITTNIVAGGERIITGFSMIDGWEVIDRTLTGRMSIVSITLSKWLFNALMSLEVLTINKDYFKLKSGLEKRIYEIARKHCGKQPSWSINEVLLHKKSGSSGNIRDFRRTLFDIIDRNSLPDYRIQYDKQKRQIRFYPKNLKNLPAGSLARALGLK